MTEYERRGGGGLGREGRSAGAGGTGSTGSWGPGCRTGGARSGIRRYDLSTGSADWLSWARGDEAAAEGLEARVVPTAGESV